MLDAITLERRGIPSVPIGTEQLVRTTGRGMARIQGVPEFPIAVISHPNGSLHSVRNAEEVEVLVEQAITQVESILLGRA